MSSLLKNFKSRMTTLVLVRGKYTHSLHKEKLNEIEYSPVQTAKTGPVYLFLPLEGAVGWILSLVTLICTVK